MASLAAIEEVLQKISDFYRKVSRLAAVGDLLLFGIGLSLIFGFAGVGLFFTAVVVDPEIVKPEDVPREEVNEFLWQLWVPVVLATLVLGVGFWAAIKLFKATEKGAEPKLAMERARHWKNVNILFFLLTCLYCAFATQSLATSALHIVYRGLMHIVVRDFIEDLERQARAAATPNPDAIVVKKY